MINKIGKAILTMFGIGHFKYAPGTLASFCTCLIWIVLVDNFYINTYSHKIFILLFLFIVTIYSIVLIDKIYKGKDSEEIVIDEFIGQSIPLATYLFIIPIYNPFTNKQIFTWFLISFIFFRFFDILKPFPINIVDKKIKNGLGVMLDDIIAGIFSAIILCIIYFYGSI